MRTRPRVAFWERAIDAKAMRRRIALLKHFVRNLTTTLQAGSHSVTVLANALDHHDQHRHNFRRSYL